MRVPAKTIWDTRIQSVCGILSAGDENHIEVFLSANFGQVSLSPARVAINPNRLYPIEAIIRKTRRFAINVMAVEDRGLAIRLLNLRRREPRKAEILGLNIRRHDLGIPYVDGVLRTVFCEVETILNTGDHTLMIARVLESYQAQTRAGQRPLLYREISGFPSRFPFLTKMARSILAISGALDLIKKVLGRRSLSHAVSIAEATYLAGGQTEEEIAEILQWGALDHSRVLTSPVTPAIIKNKLGVCVVGTGWGAFHCELIRKVCPGARLFVCGRNPEKTARLGRAIQAEDIFLDLEKAVKDSRVQAFTLALPHHLHRQAVELVSAAGKHVMVEKPIATTLTDADAMIDAARRAGVILMVGEDMHFRPVVREAARRISNGDVGEPLYLMASAGGVRRPSGWAADKNQMGGGVLMDIGVHYVRGMRLLMGEPDRVMASRAMQIHTKMSGEDSIQLMFSSVAGWQAHMLLSWSTTRGHIPDIAIMGEKGTIHLWPGMGYVDYYPVAPTPIMRMIAHVRPYSLQRKLLHPTLQRERIYLKDADKTGYESEFKEFLAAVVEERQPASLPEDGRRDLEIVLRGYEALNAKAWIDIGGYPRAPFS